VTITASVMFSTAVATAPPFRCIVSVSGVNEGGIRFRHNSPSISNGAVQNQGPSPTVTLLAALTTASAATRPPLCGRAEPGADEREFGASRRRGVAEIAIGCEPAPGLCRR